MSSLREATDYEAGTKGKRASDQETQPVRLMFRGSMPDETIGRKLLRESNWSLWTPGSGER